MKKKDTPAPDDKETASTVVEAEVITESESTDPPAVSYTIIGGDGDEYGPVSIEDIARWIRTDRANERTLVRSDEASQWQPLVAVPELALLLTGAPPPKPGKVKAIAIMTLVGGIWSVMVALGLVSGLVTCLVCPCTAFLKIPSFCLIPARFIHLWSVSLWLFKADCCSVSTRISTCIEHVGRLVYRLGAYWQVIFLMSF